MTLATSTWWATPGGPAAAYIQRVVTKRYVHAV